MPKEPESGRAPPYLRVMIRGWGRPAGHGMHSRTTAVPRARAGQRLTQTIDTDARTQSPMRSIPPHEKSPTRTQRATSRRRYRFVAFRGGDSAAGLGNVLFRSTRRPASSGPALLPWTVGSSGNRRIGTARPVRLGQHLPDQVCQLGRADQDRVVVVEDQQILGTAEHVGLDVQIGQRDHGLPVATTPNANMM